MSHPSRSPSRRQFLQGSTAAAAGLFAAGGPAVWSAGAPSAIPRRVPVGREGPGDGPIRLGVVGVGGMGSAHCERIMALAREGKENVQITAIADVAKPNVDRNVARCAEQQGIPVQGYRYYREMLAREDLHAILTATPEHWHAQVAIDALRAGMDVYVEKPMTLRLEDAFRLWRACQGTDRFVQVGTQFIMREKYHEARRLIKEGVIGHPTFSQTSYCRNSPAGEWNYYEINPEIVPGEMLDWAEWCGALGPRSFDTYIFHRWRRYRDFSTGIIGDLLVHVLTPLVMAVDAGWPVRVTATGGHYLDKAMENHDQVNLTIQFEREHTMIVAGSTCNATGLEDLVRGNKANLFLGGNNCELRPEASYQDEIDPVQAKFDSVPDQDLLRLDFLRCVRTREQNASPVDLGLKVMVIVDLATRALWDGGSYGFSPAGLSAFRI